MKRLLILSDGKAGHENQSKAFARMLGFGFDVANVAFRSPLAKAASYLADRLAVDSLSLLRVPQIAAGEYRAVVGTGSGTFYAAKTLAKKLGVPCAVVLYPRGYRLSDFGCVMAPAFDRPPRLANIIRIPANIVAADAEFYEMGVAEFRARHDVDGRKAVAVVIGGPNKCATMTPEWTRRELERVFSANPGCAFWATTSRRTPADVEAVVDSFPWDYKLIYSRDRFNPIPAFVALASRMYVTADSTGMLSEACTCGEAEVFALDNLKPGRHKFRRFADGLAAEGCLGGRKKIDMGPKIAAAKKLLGL